MKLTFAVLAAIIFYNSNAFAALGKEGGGGKGVVCRDLNQDIRSVELLDLWEARNVHHLKIVNSTGDLKGDLDLATERSKNVLLEETANFSNETVEQLKFISYGITGFRKFSSMERLRQVDLPLTSDSFEGNLNLPSNCKVEQIAIFYQPSDLGSYRWQINSDLLDKMDNVNLAALALHEAFYAHLGTYGWETNSLRIRRVVGQVMSGKSILSHEDLLNKPYVRCAVDGTFHALNSHVYFFQNIQLRDPKITMLVTNVRGSRLIDFSHPLLESSQIDFSLDIAEFYYRLNQSNSMIQITAKGNPQDIEFDTQVNFQMQSGVGIVAKTKVTGGGFKPAPVENLKCQLVN